MKRLVLAALVAAMVLPTPAMATRTCVTYREAQSIKRGMTFEQVHAIIKPAPVIIDGYVGETYWMCGRPLGYTWRVDIIYTKALIVETRVLSTRPPFRSSNAGSTRS